MDTFSSSVSSLNIPSLPTPLSRELRRVKTITKSHRLQPPTKPTSIISHRPAYSPSSSSSYSFTHKNTNYSTSILFSSSEPPKSPRADTNPATGYAAALISISQSKNCLKKTQEDVQRLSEFLDGCIGEEGKWKVVKEVVERGKFGKYLVGVVKMLAERSKVGILGEILEEFERIYDELVGTKVVWVSSRKKMEEEDLFGIAERVQTVSGGAVKVKVRNLVDESLAVAFAK